MISASASTIMKKNGIDARATYVLSRPLMVCNTNMLNPTGGVTSAISTRSTMKMPNHTRSKPAFSIIGSTIEVVSTIIDMPSSAVPSRM